MDQFSFRKLTEDDLPVVETWLRSAKATPTDIQSVYREIIENINEAEPKSFAILLEHEPIGFIIVEQKPNLGFKIPGASTLSITTLIGVPEHKDKLIFARGAFLNTMVEGPPYDRHIRAESPNA